MADPRTQTLPLPLAETDDRWGYVERSDLGEHGACDLVYRVPVGADAGPTLPEETARALPLLLHEFDRQDGLEKTLRRYQRPKVEGHHEGPSPKAILRRILPRLVTYRYVESRSCREFVFQGHRPSSIHVLSRVLRSGFKMRLEDLSHFATHGEHLMAVLHTVGLGRALDPEGILYCPALDSPYPFKFAVVGHTRAPNRATYVDTLKAILRQTEKDEEFRERNFRELMRGFQKFGPASATPQFQEVELKIWRLLTYLAARLRVKAGRLTDTRSRDEVRQFLGELRHVHDALDDLVHLPGRLAAFYRNRFDLELSNLYEHVLPELDAIAKRIDCDLEDRDKSIDAVARLVSEFRRLGSASPLESLEAHDVQIKQTYGDVEVPQVETGWVRTYTETIFTGAKRYDTRRYGAVDEEEAEGGAMDEEDLELDVDLNFSFGLGGGGDGGDEGGGGGDEGEDDWGLSDLDVDMDWGE